MGRLENIIARDRDRRRMTSKKVLWIGIAALVVFVAIAMLFTDLGTPQAPPAPAIERGGERHLDGVQLRRGH